MSSTTQAVPSCCNMAHPVPLSSSYIRSNIAQFTSKTADLATQILAPKNIPYEGPVIIRERYYPMYSYYPTSPWFYSRPSMIVIDRHGRRRHNHDDGSRVLLGIVAALGAMIASYTIGTAIISLKDSQSELSKTKQDEKKFVEYQKQAGPEDKILVNQAIEAVCLKDRICSRIRNSAIWDLALKITLAIGLVLTAVGSFVCPPLIGLGLLVSVIAGGALLCKGCFETKDRDNYRDAGLLREYLESMKQI